MSPGTKASDARAYEIGPNMLLVVRSDDTWTHEQRETLETELREKYPSWNGFLLFLRTDQAVETLPEPFLRKLSLELNKLFGHVEPRSIVQRIADRQRLSVLAIADELEIEGKWTGGDIEAAMALAKRLREAVA